MHVLGCVGFGRSGIVGGYLKDTYMDGWMDGRMDGWMDGRMDGLIDGCLG